MAKQPDIAALKAAAADAEREYLAASAIKASAVKTASEKWKLAAAASSRYSRAKDKMQLAQMRARSVVSAGTANDPA